MVKLLHTEGNICDYFEPLIYEKFKCEMKIFISF